MTTQSVAAVDGRDYGAFISAALDDAGLDPYEFRVYARIARRAGTGDCFETQSAMAEGCQMGERKLRDALKALKERGMIGPHGQSNNGAVVYRLTPREEWAAPHADPVDTGAPHADPPGTTCRTPPAPHADGRESPGRESREGNQDDDASSSEPDQLTLVEPGGRRRRRGRQEVDRLFDWCWENYPRHSRNGKPGGGGSRSKAREIFGKLDASEQDQVALAIPNYRVWCQRDDGEFAAHMTTWLNQRRWEQWQEPAAAPKLPPGRQFEQCDRFDGKQWAKGWYEGSEDDVRVYSNGR